MATIEWILASGSPRRRELLEGLGVRFRVRTAHDEEFSLCTEPTAIVQDLALQKARSVAALEHESVAILAADTLVAIENEVLGKPRDFDENRKMLERLSGRIHKVHTGIALITPVCVVSQVETTLVQFRQLSDKDIDWYVGQGDGLDKAGGYGIQGAGMLLIERIEGDYFNVMGLPVVRVLQLCREWNIQLVEGL